MPLITGQTYCQSLKMCPSMCMRWNKFHRNHIACQNDVEDPELIIVFAIGSATYCGFKMWFI